MFLCTQERTRTVTDFSICFWNKRGYQLHHLGKFAAGEGLEPSIFNSKILTCLPRSNCTSWLQIALRMLTTVIFFIPLSGQIVGTLRFELNVPICRSNEIRTHDLNFVRVALLNQLSYAPKFEMQDLYITG